MRAVLIGLGAALAATAAQAQTTYYYGDQPRSGGSHPTYQAVPVYPPAGYGTIYTSPQYEAQTGVNRYYWNGQNYRALGPHDTGGLTIRQ